jgi:hypothetical protein
MLSQTRNRGKNSHIIKLLRTPLRLSQYPLTYTLAFVLSWNALFSQSSCSIVIALPVFTRVVLSCPTASKASNRFRYNAHSAPRPIFLRFIEHFLHCIREVLGGRFSDVSNSASLGIAIPANLR